VFLVLYVCVGVVVVVFAALGINSGTYVTETNDRIEKSVLDFVDAAASYTNSIATFVESNANKIGDSLLSIQASFSSLMDVVIGLKNNLSTALGSLSSSLLSLESALRTATSDNAAVCSFCSTNSNSALSAKASIDAFDIKNVSLSAGTTIAQQIKDQSKSVTDSIRSAGTQFDDISKQIKDGRESMTPIEKIIETACAAVFGVNIAFVLVSLFGLLFRKPLLWWGPFWLLILELLLLWLVLGLVYPPTYLLGGICDLLPTPTGGGQAIASQFSGSTRDKYNSFLGQCLASSSGSLFTVFDISTDTFNRTIQDFSLSKQINITAITSAWDTSSFTDVVNSQANLTSISLQSVIQPYNATLWTKLSSTLATLNSQESGTYTYSTVDTCTCSNSQSEKSILSPFVPLAKSIDSIKAVSGHVLGNQTLINSAVGAVQTAVTDADTTVKTLLNSILNGFLDLGLCGWLGKGYNNIRLSFCDGFVGVLSAIWLCAGVLVITGTIFLWMLPAMNKRFSRRRGQAAQKQGGGEKAVKQTDVYEMTAIQSTGGVDFPPPAAPVMDVPSQYPNPAPQAPVAYVPVSQGALGPAQPVAGGLYPSQV
jgi:hypothetical protein